MSISSLLSQLVDIFRNWSHDTPEPYVLPAATTTTLGGVKVGDNLTVTEDGTLSGAEPEEKDFDVMQMNLSTNGTTITVRDVNRTPQQVYDMLSNGKTVLAEVCVYPAPTMPMPMGVFPVSLFPYAQNGPKIRAWVVGFADSPERMDVYLGEVFSEKIDNEWTDWSTTLTFDTKKINFD